MERIENHWAKELQEKEKHHDPPTSSILFLVRLFDSCKVCVEKHRHFFPLFLIPSSFAMLFVMGNIMHSFLNHSYFPLSPILFCV